MFNLIGEVDKSTFWSIIHLFLPFSFCIFSTFLSGLFVFYFGFVCMGVVGERIMQCVLVPVSP